MKTFLRSTLSVLAAVVLFTACEGTDPALSTAKLDIRNKDYEKARVSLEKAIENNPNNGDAYQMMGEVLYELAQQKSNPADRADLYTEMRSNFDKAVVIFDSLGTKSKELFLIDNKIKATWTNEHTTGYKIFDVDEPSEDDINRAIAHLTNATIVEPSETVNFEVLADMYYTKKDYSSAIASLEKAISMVEKAEADRYVRLFYFYSQNGQTEQAIEVLKTARVLYPDNTDVVQYLANVYLQERKIEEALAVVKSLIDRDPENPQYRLVYGTQLYSLTNSFVDANDKIYNQIEDVKKEIKDEKRKGAKSDKKKITAWEKQIESLEKEADANDAQINKMTDDALREVVKVTEMTPNDAMVWQTVAIIIQNKAAALTKKYNSTEDFDKAEAYKKQITKLLNEALPYYEKVVELTPDDKDAWGNLYRMYLNLGKVDEAMKAMEKAGLD